MKAVNIKYLPYTDYGKDPQKAPWQSGGFWPCKWVQCAAAGNGPFAAAFRKTFSLDRKSTIRVHVSADERYELFVDGKLIGRGSERGDKYNWYFETYDLELDRGYHIIVARTWSLGRNKPVAQISVHPGFIFSPEQEEFIKLLGTGVAEWEAKVLEGYSFVPFEWGKPQWIATGAKLRVDGHAFPWGFENGEDSDWLPAAPSESGYSAAHNYILDNVHVMKPAVLPPQLEELKTVGVVRFVEGLASVDGTETRVLDNANDIASEHEKWNGLLHGKPVTVEPDTIKRVIIDLEDYYCIYPLLELSGGKDSFVRIYWGEACYSKDENGCYKKGDRDIIDGHVFRGEGDEFVTDGGKSRRFDTLWWHAGRYVELLVKTSSEALQIDSLQLYETRYPLSMESIFECDDVRFDSIRDISFRTLQMCAHETYMDCPYYEQLMYVGDTRLQVLVSYACTLDARLPAKALKTFSHSAFNHTGLVKCAYPEAGGKVIPSFCLWWIGMVYDYALWRGDKDVIKPLMPTVRNTVERYIADRNSEGLLYNPEGWNFYDWANNGDNKFYNDNKHWSFGVPAFNDGNINGIFNLHMVLTLRYLARLEEYLGEKEMAARADRLSIELFQRVADSFWDEDKGLFADDLKHEMYSEHAQSLAVLSGLLDEAYIARIRETLNSPNDLMGASIYFSHYVIEALDILGCEAEIYRKLAVWNTLERDGLKTTPEVFADDTRSDCHAWGAHPLYHMFATILGIRPASMGFDTVQIKPKLGHLNCVKGTLVHPYGLISVEINKIDSQLKASIKLPGNLTGTLSYGEAVLKLRPGRQEYLIETDEFITGR